MTPPDPQQVAEIAGRLSKAQREAVLDEVFSLRRGTHRIRKQLLAKDVMLLSGVLTVTGLAVRNFIQGNHHD